MEDWSLSISIGVENGSEVFCNPVPFVGSKDRLSSNFLNNELGGLQLGMCAIVCLLIVETDSQLLPAADPILGWNRFEVPGLLSRGV
jgi:hypothetical protein